MLRGVGFRSIVKTFTSTRNLPTVIACLLTLVFVDTGVLRGIFEKLGFGTITEEDVKILVETADVDKDGKISLEDFRLMIDTNQEPVTKK